MAPPEFRLEENEESWRLLDQDDYCYFGALLRSCLSLWVVNDNQDKVELEGKMNADAVFTDPVLGTETQTFSARRINFRADLWLPHYIGFNREKGKTLITYLRADGLYLRGSKIELSHYIVERSKHFNGFIIEKSGTFVIRPLILPIELSHGPFTVKPSDDNLVRLSEDAEALVNRSKAKIKL